MTASSRKSPRRIIVPQAYLDAPPGEKADTFRGTSAACPHVAGFAALLSQMRKQADPRELAKLIADATTPLADNRGAGRGLIDGSKVSGGQNARRNGHVPDGLSRVLELANDDNDLGAKVVVGRPQYSIGDGLKIGYRAKRDAYCVMVHLGSDGEVTPLLPVEGNDLRLQAGERYAYPADSQTTIKITGPAGSEEVGLICSASKIRLEGIADLNRSSLSVSIAQYKIVE